jgi:hypothetical protein
LTARAVLTKINVDLRLAVRCCSRASQLGLRWRVLGRLGMSYADELDQYERAVAKALAHDGGAAILDLARAAGPALVGPWNVPESNFGGI